MPTNEILKAIDLDEKRLEAFRHYSKVDRMPIKEMLRNAVWMYVETRRIHGRESV